MQKNTVITNAKKKVITNENEDENYDVKLNKQTDFKQIYKWVKVIN